MVEADRQPGTNGQPVRWAFELNQHRRWLRTVIYARVGNPDAVDDVLQEVLLAAVEEKTPIESPSGWLYRLAVRQSLLYRRKLGREHRRRKRLAERSPGSNGRSIDDDPLGWLLAGERAELVRRALNSLPDRERELLALKYSEDWSCQQMAEHLDLSKSAVEARLHRARRHLRHKLAKLNIVDES